MTLGDVLDGMFRLLVANWRTYVVALGVILIPLNFIVSYLTTEVYGGAGLIEQVSNPAAAEAFLAGGPDLVPFIGLIVVALGSFLLVTPYVNGLACHIAAAAYEGGTPTPAGALRQTAGKYWSLVGVTLLVMLIPTVMLGIPVGLLVAGAAGDVGALGVLGGLLLLVAIVAAVWAAVSMSLSYAVVVVERAGPVAAVRRSFRLVRGRFWRVLGTLVLGAIIGGMVAQIVALPFSLPGDAFGRWLGVVFTTAGGVVSAVVSTPLTGNVQTLLYFDGRIRQEGYDLELLTRQVTGEAEQPFG